MNDFDTLYGSQNVSFNVHCHLHLPDQVKRFGPLNKLSCFPFEGVFKICSTLFHGTRNIFYQIAFNLNVHSFILHNFGSDQINSIECNELKVFLSKLNSHEKKSSQTGMTNSTSITVDELPFHERNLLSIFNNDDLNIETFTSVWFKGMQLNIFNSKYKCQNFSVSYSSVNHNLKFGFIVHLYKINNFFYAAIQKLKKSKSFTENISLEERLNEFFLICELENDFELISFNQIINKCVLIENKNEYFVSVCNELNEHD